MKTPTRILIFAALISMTACVQEDLDSPVVDARENTADYMVNNNSDQDISITYVTSSKLGFKESNGYITIPSQSTKKIYGVSFIVEEPNPSSALSTISFYHTTGLNHEVVLANSPVRDGNWKVIEQSLNEEGYGYTRYQLSYSNVVKD